MTEIPNKRKRIEIDWSDEADPHAGQGVPPGADCIELTLRLDRLAAVTTDQLADLTRQTFEDSQRLLTDLIDVMDAGVKAMAPSNWRGGAEESSRDALSFFRRAVSFAKETKWPIVWLPRRSVVAALLDVRTEEADDLLVSHRNELLEDAHAVLDEITWDDLTYAADCAREVAGAMEAGFDRAAQTLAASVLVGTLGVVFGYDRVQGARRSMGEDQQRGDSRLLLYTLIAAAAHKAFELYWPDKGDPVPPTFNRHALHHTVSPAQLTEVNALVGLMLICSLLRELQLLRDRGLLEPVGTADGAAS